MDTKLLKSVFSFSIPMGLASAISTLSVQLDQLMVGRFFSTEELAVFSNAAKELPLQSFHLHLQLCWFLRWQKCLKKTEIMKQCKYGKNQLN